MKNQENSCTIVRILARQGSLDLEVETSDHAPDPVRVDTPREVDPLTRGGRSDEVAEQKRRGAIPLRVEYCNGFRSSGRPGRPSAQNEAAPRRGTRSSVEKKVARCCHRPFS